MSTYQRPCYADEFTADPAHTDLICAQTVADDARVGAEQNGGYRLSSGTQRELHSVTEALWLRTPDRRL